jgi:hypothetical protein
MSRRFITKVDIDAVAETGRDILEVDQATTVTDLAREHALARGVRIVRQGEDTRPQQSATGKLDDDLRSRVRAAVVARLGNAPDGLDAVLDRELRARDRPAPASE